MPTEIEKTAENEVITGHGLQITSEKVRIYGQVAMRA